MIDLRARVHVAERNLPDVHHVKARGGSWPGQLLFEDRTVKQPVGRVLIFREIGQIDGAKLRYEIRQGGGGFENSIDNSRLHVLQDLALATELARRIECDLEPALALALDDLRHAPAADHQRMLRIENACDLEGLDILRRDRSGECSGNDGSDHCT